MELYTSLVRVKMAMHGGQMPPMTPIPAKLEKVIDPKYTIGLGALAESARWGLRCPVRGCGKWYHYLSHHANMMHGKLGGADGVKRLLGIPPTAPLMSTAARERLRSQALATDAAANLTHSGMVSRARDRKRLCSRRRSYTSIGYSNLKNSCPTQISHRMADLRNKLGRSPARHEAAAEYGSPFVHAVVDLYGSWNNALAQLEMPLRLRRGYKVEDALASLAAWHERHGSLPTLYIAQKGERLPLMMSYATIMRLLGTDSWPEAMRRAAALLNIHGGRYGLPEEFKQRPGTAA